MPIKNTVKHKLINVADLVPYARNSRTHSDEQIQQIAKSIEEFGFLNPVIVDGNNGIVAGHGRVMACELLGIAKVPCVIASHLTEEQIRAYVIADNQLALNAGWDLDTLKVEIEGLQDVEFDVDLLGFDGDFLDDLLADEPEEGLTDEDAVPEPPEQPVTVLGDVWTLGKHRLMCGDSTSIDAVEELMDGKKADMVFTDPPYNVGFNGRSGKHDVIKNDNLSEDEFSEFISAAIKTIKALDPPIYYIWCNWKFYGILQGKLDYKCCIVWAKNSFGMGAGYRHQHEFCLYSGKIDSHIKNESDLWVVKKDSAYSHPTQKPVELSVRAMRNHAKQENIVDLFGGSGSTLLGAEQCGRNGFVMELDEKYCDVIINRWQEFTGKDAVHAESGKTYNELKAETNAQT